MKVVRILCLFSTMLMITVACKDQIPTENHAIDEQLKKDSLADTMTVKRVEVSEVPAFLAEGDLVDIQTIDDELQIDLKYATQDNFTGQILYTDVTKVYLQREVAEMLKKANHYLMSLHPTYRLLVYDGLRPRAVQQKMWDALDSIPVHERTKFVSNPKNGSIHNYGCAVDLTIVDDRGVVLDMGAGYDDIRRIAYPKFEAEFLASQELTLTHIQHRQLLRKVMKFAGFYNIATEWWHFNAFTRDEAKKRYKIVE